MKLNFILQTIILLLLNIDYTYEDRVTIQSNLRKWKKKKNCGNTFTYKSNMWKAPICKAQACVLTTEYISTKHIKEITITMKINFMMYSGDLLVKFKRRPKHLKDITTPIARTSSDQFTQMLNVENYEGLIIEFHNLQGFCGEIHNLLITSITCIQSSGHLSVFPNQYAPSLIDDPLYIKGACKENAEPAENEVHKYCYSNGSVKAIGECICSPGFTLVNQRCILCLDGQFKDNKGNGPCKSCGINSYSDNNNSKCRCKDGYYRLRSKQNIFTSKCFSTKPRNFELISISSESAYLKWQEHNYLLNTGHLSAYKITCKNCDVKEGNFPITVTSKYAELTNLKPNKIYYISIFAEHENFHDDIIAGQALEVKFTTLKATKIETYVVIIIAVTASFIISSCLIILCLFVNQKRTTLSFMQRINSLKRSRRPPRPPSATESVSSEINPYAVYKPAIITKNPVNLIKKEIGIHNTDFGLDNHDKDVLIDNTTEGYVSMSSEARRRIINNNHYVGTPKILPTPKPTQKLLPQVDEPAYSNQQHDDEPPYYQQRPPRNLNFLEQEEQELSNHQITFSYIEKQRLFSRETYSRQRSSTTLNPDLYHPESLYINNVQGNDIYDNRVSNVIQEDIQVNNFPACDIDVPTPMKEFRSRNRSATVLTPELSRAVRSEKTESCYVPHGFSYIKINESNFDKNYRRAESKNNLNTIVMPKRPHSADDVNRINSFV